MPDLDGLPYLPRPTTKIIQGGFQEEWEDCLVRFQDETVNRSGSRVSIEGLGAIGDLYPDLMTVINLSDNVLMRLTGYDKDTIFWFKDHLVSYELMKWWERQIMVRDENRAQMERMRGEYAKWREEFKTFLMWQQRMEERNRSWWSWM